VRYTSRLFPQLSRAGEWFLRSGIHETSGGVARYYRADLQRNQPVSTEITGYAVSALVYLHSVTKDERYLERALAGARFLAHIAWDRASQTMPFEIDPASLTYFFDCGIVVRGLLSAWHASGTDEFLDVAAALGRSMALDFASPDNDDIHPVLSLPDKRPLPRDPLRWSRSPGCYQLKAAMAWWDLAEATGDARFRAPYDRALAHSLQTSSGFLPGHPEKPKVVDRLHAFLYFLEGLLPCAGQPHCAAAMCAGIRSVAHHLRCGADPLVRGRPPGRPFGACLGDRCLVSSGMGASRADQGARPTTQFERSDVYAQLLRIRLYADWAGAAPLDRDAAQFEADRLSLFQAVDSDPRIDGGFCFGRTEDAWSPHVNPVSTAFALQALALWEASLAGEAQMHRHLLI